MRVFISADIEGVTGVVSWSQCGRPDGEHYDFRWARERMTGDVNAAIRGARAAGATEVVVKDSHGNSKNLLVDQLEPGARLISGHGARLGGMMAGLDRTFGAALLIGYHAMAGTEGGILEHTISGWVHRMWINGMPAGEIALSTALAGCFGVPVVTVSSDEAGCDEAARLIPGVRTAATKTGYGRYMGLLRHPSETAPLIEEAARGGVEAAPEIAPWLPDLPATVRIEANRSEEADVAAKAPGVRRLDAYTLEYTADSWAEAYQGASMILALGLLGRNADR
jgi:D-amino peptidase